MSWKMQGHGPLPARLGSHKQPLEAPHSAKECCKYEMGGVEEKYIALPMAALGKRGLDFLLYELLLFTGSAMAGTCPDG